MWCWRRATEEGQQRGEHQQKSEGGATSRVATYREDADGVDGELIRLVVSHCERKCELGVSCGSDGRNKREERKA